MHVSTPCSQCQGSRHHGSLTAHRYPLYFSLVEPPSAPRFRSTKVCGAKRSVCQRRRRGRGFHANVNHNERYQMSARFEGTTHEQIQCRSRCSIERSDHRDKGGCGYTHDILCCPECEVQSVRLAPVCLFASCDTRSGIKRARPQAQ